MKKLDFYSDTHTGNSKRRENRASASMQGSLKASIIAVTPRIKGHYHGL